MRIKSFLLAIVCLPFAFASVQLAHATFTFEVGDYYSSNNFSDVITQYNGAGNVVGSITLPSAYGSEVRGLAFGPDNLLYATLQTAAGFSVYALNSAGVAQQTYSGNVYVGGNLSFGKISMDSQYLYVAGQDQLTRFLLGNPSSGTVIYTNNQIYDTKPLPNGNLLVASAYSIQEITTAGAVVRTLNLLGGDNLPLNDIRGIEYNPATNDLFVTELGHTGFGHQTIRFDGTTGMLERNTAFYGDDLFLTASGQLLVGSRAQSPTFFDQDLNALGTLQGGQQMFVTQLVPEPSSIALGLTGSLILGLVRYRGRRRS